jgi:hypothetical protein
MKSKCNAASMRKLSGNFPPTALVSRAEIWGKRGGGDEHAHHVHLQRMLTNRQDDVVAERTARTMVTCSITLWKAAL